jgi:hypothetical protein
MVSQATALRMYEGRRADTLGPGLIGKGGWEAIRGRAGEAR